MKQFLNLWIPIFFSNSIIMLAGLFDTIFLSHFSSFHVAALAVSLSIYSLIFVFGIGVLQGTMQELSEANGRRDEVAIQRIVKQSILIVLCLSFCAGWLLNHLDPLLYLLKVSDELKALIQPCLWLLSWTIPVHLLLRIFYILTQSCGQAKQVMYANLLYLLLKVSMAYTLIFGQSTLGIQAYGVEGAFIANLMSQWLMLVIFYLLFLEKRLKLQWQGAFLHFKTLLKILTIGLPAGVVVFIDMFAVSAIALLVLPLGDSVVNAHQVMLGLLGLMFMLPLSLSSAFGILVSTRIGAKELHQAWKLSRYAVMLVLGVGMVVASLVLALRQPIMAIFSSDAQVIAIGLSLILLLCWMHICDALLVMSLGILRCWKVVVLPMVMVSICLLALGLGGGWYLAYHPFEWSWLGVSWSALGIHGFWWMLAISYSCASISCLVCLILRYRKYLKTA